MKEEEVVWLSRVFRKVDMFENLTMKDMSDLMEHIEKVRFKAGCKIVRQGDRGDSFFILYKGKVKVAKFRFLFFRSKVGWLGPEDFFGEMSLLSDAPRSATVTAVEDTECFVLYKGHFDHMMKKNPAFAQLMKDASARRQSR